MAQRADWVFRGNRQRGEDTAPYQRIEPRSLPANVTHPPTW